MVWTFGTFRLDPERHELTRAGLPVPVEPQVFAVILHLVRQCDRMVSKGELAETIWPGAAVSDASIAGRIKLARVALGDDGERQEVIRTIHGVGFRFVAPVTEDRARPPTAPFGLGRPSVAVLPLRVLGAETGLDILAEAIPHEVILALSRLRWIAVIARGSSFRFRHGADFDLVASSLGARYVLSGVMEAGVGTVAVTLELTDCKNSEVIWADCITRRLDALAELRALIAMRIIAALELRVPENEARHAELSGSAAFDAWASFHLGLRHLYRFTDSDNAAAKGHFQRSVALDPGFARAQAGLSFTSFIEAFLRIVPDVRAASRAALHHAERGLELDPLDPFVNFTMGRAHWLTGEVEMAQRWLSRATEINPNYAHGFYASGFTAMLLGDATASNRAVDSALELSPLDPLLYGMYGVRAQMLIQQGHYAAAAEWAAKAASAPGAHHLIAMIAAAAFDLAEVPVLARHWAEAARSRRPDVSARDYSLAFPIRDIEKRRMIEAVLNRHGF
ncbi:winged helix-turn-helix domain-containing protein [Albidovulum sediminis]|uniref:Winged helix-turn-helix domain-containing protein n=1 Tax=Albidovulum sediminis TaxID=3066345 RepID=A0ABT2NJQ5_9RHOB|nr:winged helix-turn-helix domain-containing protein [Defluviimonas sediminis]MCT8328965.1 winged helix-turn-helix domain-containing protein [Defluviimonas sediminis]